MALQVAEAVAAVAIPVVMVAAVAVSTAIRNGNSSFRALAAPILFGLTFDGRRCGVLDLDPVR